MARIMALDYGQKRTGIAVTDNMQLIASPLTTVNTSELLTFLKNYMKTEQVEKIIIGLPIRADGSIPPWAKEIIQFSKILNNQFPNIKIEFFNEAYTSIRAQQALIQAGVKKKKRSQKGSLDKMAAAIMLQEYLGNI